MKADCTEKRLTLYLACQKLTAAQEMSPTHTTKVTSQGYGFPTTQWHVVSAVGDGEPAADPELLNLLITLYWKPVFYYLRRLGYSDDDAKDILQSFFIACLEKEFFGKADAARGRFRTFLLKCLGNFLKNRHRAEWAQRRRPAGGMVSLDELMGDESRPFQPRASETPEDVFCRAWAVDALRRVLSTFEQESRVAGRCAHYELFRQRIINPTLEGTKPPALRDLAFHLKMTEKQAANCLITARRAFQRLLREEIRPLVASEDEVTDEIRHLFSCLARG